MSNEPQAPEICEGCKRPKSTDMHTYCVPAETPQGKLCHKCRQENADNWRMFGEYRYRTQAQWKEIADANKRQWQDMFHHYWPEKFLSSEEIPGQDERREFLESIVDNPEYTAYVEHLHTPNVSEY